MKINEIKVYQLILHNLLVDNINSVGIKFHSFTELDVQETCTCFHYNFFVLLTSCIFLLTLSKLTLKASGVSSYDIILDCSFLFNKCYVIAIKSPDEIIKLQCFSIFSCFHKIELCSHY